MRNIIGRHGPVAVRHKHKQTETSGRHANTPNLKSICLVVLGNPNFPAKATDVPGCNKVASAVIAAILVISIAAAAATRTTKLEKKRETTKVNLFGMVKKKSIWTSGCSLLRTGCSGLSLWVQLRLGQHLHQILKKYLLWPPTGKCFEDSFHLLHSLFASVCTREDPLAGNLLLALHMSLILVFWFSCAVSTEFDALARCSTVCMQAK